ncbi:MAG TPA: efflux RND transporter permease subunit, partial [Bdellovibrionales bacterium]|nr:efflux RND transporter permease subunit [Bdellovibrionales bacterium]
VSVSGVRKREIRVHLDREKLKRYQMSASMVASRIAESGRDAPAGRHEGPRNETVYRTIGQFKSLDDIGATIVNFMGNDVSVPVSRLGQVTDGFEDESAVSFINGKRAQTLSIFKQSGTNTVSVADAIQARVEKMNRQFRGRPGAPKLTVVHDSAKIIKDNLTDVKESILIGIVLTVLVVFMFLGSPRSTVITGLALPNSLIGAFILMALAGFTVNLMTLLALSLAVGLLVDDAIVVRENIFRHMELGKSPLQAALEGTKEVTLAVVATTFTVIAVFGPIGFLHGTVGQFFKEFGLTICFAMLISLFDALTIAPMMSAYWGGTAEQKKAPKFVQRFQAFKNRLEAKYDGVLRWAVAHPGKVLASSGAFFVASLIMAVLLPKTFVSTQDTGEVILTMEPGLGTSLQQLTEVALKADQDIRARSGVELTQLSVGPAGDGSYKATFYVKLLPAGDRELTTSELRDAFRSDLAKHKEMKTAAMESSGPKPFSLTLMGQDSETIEAASAKVVEKLKAQPGLKDVESSFKAGIPEFQVVIDPVRAEQVGVSTVRAGEEIRTQIEGKIAAVFRQNGQEYGIRVRLDESQRNLEDAFYGTVVPNINGSLIPLSEIAKPVKTFGPVSILRENRMRTVQITAQLAADGPGLAKIVSNTRHILDKEAPLPEGVSYSFGGQAQDFADLVENIIIAVGLGIVFIYLVLASLYESFLTPFTIMLVLPLAASGAFASLFVVQKPLEVFSMIGCIMLMGIATKNSILLVDYVNQLRAEGKSLNDAILEAGRVRLRPILMTSFALIAGMLPVAIGFNEASKPRTGMGISIIGGLVSSTLLALVVIPAALLYIEKFRLGWPARLQRIRRRILIFAKVRSN